MGLQKRGAVFIEPLEVRRMLAGQLGATQLVGSPADFIAPRHLTTVGDEVFFVAQASDGAGQLWESNGTVTTQLTTDFSVPSYQLTLVAAGNTLYFAVPGSISVWNAKSGKVETVVPDSVVGPTEAYSGAQVPLCVINDTLYFIRSSDTRGSELWRYDPGYGAKMVKDIRKGSTSSSIENMTDVGGTLYFTADDGTSANELWKSDGTAAGTMLVADIAPGKADISAAFFTAAGNRLFFTSNVKTSPIYGQLWTSDGTTAGTKLVRDLSHAAGRIISGFTAVNNRLFFLANPNVPIGAGGLDVGLNEIWRSDGTSGGTVEVTDFATKDIEGTASLNGLFYFSLNGPGFGRSDGTAAGTVILRPTLRSMIVSVVAGNRLFFDGIDDVSDHDSGLHIWTTDGTSAGTYEISSVPLNPAFDMTFYGLAAVGNRVFITNDDYYDLLGEGHLYTVGPVVGEPLSFGSISGTVFDDIDADGVRDASEAGLRGYKVFIDRNGDGICNTNEVWTTSSGRYSFSSLTPGTYVIRIVGAEGRRASTPEAYRVRVLANATTTRYFGRTTQAFLAGLVYMDANKNGTIDNGESGMGGWTVFVDANGDGILDDGESSTVTDAAGKFAISVAAGSWQVRVVPQGKYRQTSPGAGYRSVSAAAGQILAKVNFGEKRIN